MKSLYLTLNLILSLGCSVGPQIDVEYFGRRQPTQQPPVEPPVIVVPSQDLTFNWSKPTTRLNGDLIEETELGGYIIYIRLNQQDSSYSASSNIKINDAFSTQYILEGFPTGDYCFVMTALDVSGLESPYSNEVCKKVNL